MWERGPGGGGLGELGGRAVRLRRQELYGAILWCSGGGVCHEKNDSLYICCLLDPARVVLCERRVETSSVPKHGPGAVQRVTPPLPPPYTFPHPPIPMGRRMNADRADPPHVYVLNSTPQVAFVQCRAMTLSSPKRTLRCGAGGVLPIRLSFCRNSGRLPSWVRQKQSRRSFEFRFLSNGFRLCG